MPFETLDILIVNWNSGDQLRQCLRSIPAALDGSFSLRRVAVVDNASTDGSADLLPDGLPIALIRNQENRGFAAAVNQAAAGSTAGLILLLNPDTRLFANSLSGPVRYLSEPDAARVGMVSIQLVGEDGQVQRCCERFVTPGLLAARAAGLHRLQARFDSALVDWDHGQTRRVDHLIGAFYMIRRDLFEALGGMDERFFVYFEDMDLSYRAAARGWEAVYLASAQAYHKGGGTTERVKARRLAYSLRSRLLFARKHWSRFDVALVTFTALCVEPFTRLLSALLHGSASELAEVIQGYRILFGSWIGSRRGPMRVQQ